MGLISSLLTGRPISATYAPTADFWYNPDPRFGGGDTQAGYPVGPDTALRQATVNACVGLISDMVGSLPLHVHRRLDDGGKERALTHPAYALLHRRPNQRQTPKEWLTMGTQHLLTRGNFYNRIVLDGRFAVAELRPLHPDRVTVTLLDSDRRGYVYRPLRGPEQAFTQDEIVHVMGPYSLNNGITGCGVIEFARESIGAAQAQEGFAARFWRQGAEGHLAFVTPLNMSDSVRKANEEALQRRLGGWQEAHKTVLLEGGLKPERISTTARDSQYNETQMFTAQRLCQFFRVSPDMVGINDGTSQWGSGIEQRMIGFVTFTAMPWLVAIQQAVDRDLIDDIRYFAEFLTEALLRGDTVARFQAYAIAIMNGIMAENEVRVRENLNPRPGLDEPRRSANQDRGGDPRQVRPPGPPEPQPRRPIKPDDDEDEDEARAWPIIVTAAARVITKETAAVRKWHARLGATPDAWRAWAAKFYGEHVETLTKALCLGQDAARQVCASHFAALMERGLDVLDEWESQAPAALAALALEGAQQ